MKIVVITWISIQHRYFNIFLPKCYCYGSLHTEKMTMVDGNMSPTNKWVCQLLVADTLNLARRDYSSTFIVSMLPKSCQPISMYVRWQIIALRRSGLKQINIVNQFGDGQSDVDRIMSKHHQTGCAKDRPCLGGHKKQMHEGTGSWLEWQ